MKNCFVYNKSSVKMSECKNLSVDLIVASPPYNIGTKYGNNDDNVSFAKYKKIITRIIKECHRTLGNRGTLVVEAADSVFMNGMHVQLAGFIQKICLDNKFYLTERCINFSNSLNGVELIEDKRWDKDYCTKKNAHSNCHQWMVFSKIKSKFKGGEIFYINYKEEKKHPCPFPDQTINLFLSKYYKNGMTVLDPFMGTAGLGKEVLALNGKYIGYEIDTLIYKEAIKKLRK